MPKRKTASQKRKTTADTSFLAKLQILRDFAGSSFSESDMSACLRQYGYDIQVAAEKLMTGEFNSKSKSATTPSVANKRPKVTPNTASAPRSKSVSATNKSRANIKKAPAAASLSKNNAASVQNSNNGRHLWLCERWLVGLSTTKNGQFKYQESLQLSHSLTGPAMVRFRGNGVEGTLPPNVCALLTPLLREEESNLISMQAHALMEERNVPIGGDVPLSLRIFIEDPVAFFSLFDNDAPAESAAAQFFGSKKKQGRPRKVTRLPVVEAAFALLQWAQYGDDPMFESPDESKVSASEETSTDDSDEDEMKESDFEAEEGEAGVENKDTAEWAKNVVDESLEASKEIELPEAPDPAGFTHDVVLRPYQRQALYWMMQRESGNDNREELERELMLLADLSRNTSRQQPMEAPAGKDVVCEVGPVRVSQEMQLKSRTIDGIENPVNHPLWQRRFLASPDQQGVISFYVNELLGVASSKPPNPPRHCIGGILADSMGLGKTVMLLALILKDREQLDMNNGDDAMVIDEKCEDKAPEDDRKPPARSESGTTLVIAPLSLVTQWEEELATKTDLAHKVYYADTAKGGIHSKSFNGIDVVVTTYGTIQGELIASKKNGSMGSGLLSYEWHRVILDESHCIKNPSTIVSRACCMLKADKRWCVTGTPIQNSLQDVYALIKFLRHEPWCETGFWKAAITNAANQEGGDDAKTSSSGNETSTEAPLNQGGSGMNIALDRVKRLLAPLILRRTKDTLNKNGEPILTLPPTETVTVNVELSLAEREFYNALLQRSQSVFEGFIKSGTASKSWFAIFSLLNRLRQTCDHVALTVKSHLDDDEWNPDVNEKVSKEIAASPAKRTPKRASKEKDALGEEFLEGLLEKFRIKQDKENIETNYASHVAHALTKTIKSNATKMEDECPICLDCPLIHEAVITPCAHVFCRDCLIGILENNGSSSQSTVADSAPCPNDTCPSCNETIESQRIIRLSKSSSDGRITTSFLGSPQSPLKNGIVKAESQQVTTYHAARQTLEKALHGAGSSKLTAIIDELHKVWEQDPRSKVLVFSQFLGFLDLLQTALKNSGIPSGRLDGSLSLKERVAVLEKFRQDTHPVDTTNDKESRKGAVLLMSMKAGGVGINMVAASTVFICDPWWNASVEDQCISRIHRIGQTAKIVRIRKFVVKDSVEERIVSLQRRKKDMACEVLSDVNTDGEISNTAPTLEDFRVLFGS